MCTKPQLVHLCTLPCCRRVHTYSCMCISCGRSCAVLADKHARTSEQTPWEVSLSLQHRPLNPQRGGRVAGGTDRLLPICSFSQQIKSSRNARNFFESVSRCEGGGPGGGGRCGRANCTIAPSSCQLIIEGGNWAGIHKFLIKRWKGL